MTRAVIYCRCSTEEECQKDGLELVVSHINSKQDPNYRRRIREYCEEHCAGILLLAVYMGWQICGVGGMILFPILFVTLRQLNDRGVIRLWKSE